MDNKSELMPAALVFVCALVVSLAVFTAGLFWLATHPIGAIVVAFAGACVAARWV